MNWGHQGQYESQGPTNRQQQAEEQEETEVKSKTLTFVSSIWKDSVHLHCRPLPPPLHHPSLLYFNQSVLHSVLFLVWGFFFFCIACFNIFIIIILRPHLAIIIHTYVKKPNTPTVKHWAVPVNSSALRTRRLCHFCHLFQSTNIFF